MQDHLILDLALGGPQEGAAGPCLVAVWLGDQWLNAGLGEDGQGRQGG